MAELRRNKTFVPGGYYHAYSHAIGNELAFRDHDDYVTFLRIVRERLRRERSVDRFGRPLRSYHGDIALIAFCLMRNHIHLLLKQNSAHAMSSFMNSVIYSYAKQFNRRHGRAGQLFQHPYHAQPVEPERLRNVISYIHLNPFKKGIDPFTYRYSRHRYYAGLAKADWCASATGVKTFGGRAGYLRHLFDETAATDAEPFD